MTEDYEVMRIHISETKITMKTMNKTPVEALS